MIILYSWKYMLFIYFIYLIPDVLAIPQFNEVNGHYANGTTCPAITKRNILCPAVCVSDQRLCPSTLGLSSCPLGTLLCSDGTCQTSCSLNNEQNNPCVCSSYPGVTLKSCRTTDVYVNVENYHPIRIRKQTNEACSLAITNNSHSIIHTWSDEHDFNSVLWNTCDAATQSHLLIKAIPVTFTLTVFLLFFPLWGLWALYKYCREHKYHVHRVVMDEKSSETDKYVLEEDFNMKSHDDELYLRGYKNDWFGYLMVFYISFISLMWMVMLMIITLDYYGHVRYTFLFFLFMMILIHFLGLV
ncbi:hypothetical protein BDB01DRAFT_490405 [Pilobolus umbonatus]|nr:hypothetical protein BDB01DRAFT_490405 [Pilobolus umbonatus]